jgi:ATP-binding cassette subfamily A (ABC1) protein 3
MNKMNQAIIRMAANNPNIEITLVNNPFPLTQADGALADTINGFTYAFIFAIAMSFIPASIVTFIVKEREINAKHQQIVSGVGIWAYWLGNYFIDITKYMIPCLLCCMVAKVMDA